MTVRHHAMREPWFILCRVVSKLDRIPRYGRVYRLRSRLIADEPLIRQPIWRWQKRGRWGMNMLIKWGMFPAFLDELDYRHSLKIMAEEMTPTQLRRESRATVVLTILAIISAATVVLALLAGCSVPIPREGTVTEKHYLPAHIDTDMVCVNFNAQGICQVEVPVDTDVPDKWTLCFTEGCFQVSQQTYDDTEVGSHFVRSEA